MPKGRLERGKWYVSHGQFSNDYLAERTINGEHESHYFSAHCLACAKSDVLVKYGGQIDLRGWNEQGSCGLFLWAMAYTIEREKDA